jgi:hypothetical protein
MVIGQSAAAADNCNLQTRQQDRVTLSSANLHSCRCISTGQAAIVGLSRGTDRHQQMQRLATCGAEVQDTAAPWRSTLVGRTAWKINDTSDATPSLAARSTGQPVGLANPRILHKTQ